MDDLNGLFRFLWRRVVSNSDIGQPAHVRSSADHLLPSLLAHLVWFHREDRSIFAIKLTGKVLVLPNVPDIHTKVIHIWKNKPSKKYLKSDFFSG